ncbi:hypothetical protein APHAL10511_005254 [Amanita phalloides]|nr:hypothetical protein APHAL10511_005254 [Amanita phalloides]
MLYESHQPLKKWTAQLDEVNIIYKSYVTCPRLSLPHTVPMSSVCPPTEAADPPYDSTSVADTIIRSSDNVHFYVISGLLSYTEKRDGLPVIPLPEDSEIIRLLLDFLYPHTTEPQLDGVELFWYAGEAVKKYCMDVIENNVYAAATDLEWDDVANSAASKVLKMQRPYEEISEFQPSLYCEELQHITGTGFYRFLEYFFRCARSAEVKHEKLATSFTSAGIADTDNSQVSSDAAKDDPPCGFDRFRSLPNTDLILRSSDSIDFFVSSTLIRLVSSIFDSMFPLKDHESQDGRPIISIQESSKVLLRIVRVIYHDPGEL